MHRSRKPSNAPEQRRVQHIGAVGRHHNLHLPERLEAVQLREQLHEGSLDLAVCGGRGRAYLTPTLSVPLALLRCMSGRRRGQQEGRRGSRRTCRRPIAITLAANGIDLIHENDARLVILGVTKHLSNDT